MKFTPEQVKQFREEGYVVVPNFWTEREVAAMRAELGNLKDKGFLRNVATDGDGVTHSQVKVNLQMCPMSPNSTFFRAMPYAERVGPAVAQLIGDPVALHLDQVFLKPGRQGAGTNWHQDNAYFKIADPLTGTAMWTAVHDATAENGTIRIVPGSFREQYEHSRDPDSDHHIRCYPDESRAFTVELKAGGAVFFAYGTAHATGANNTDSERAGVALHFLNADLNDTNDAFFTGGKRPLLTGPETTGGEREYGVRVAGTWEEEIEALLNQP